jgi:hypothetical protein
MAKANARAAEIIIVLQFVSTNPQFRTEIRIAVNSAAGHDEL